MNHLPSCILSGLLAALALHPLTCFAQREAEVHGKSIFAVTEDDNITLKEAKRKCILLARADAIKNEFGEFVSSDVIDSNSEVNGEQGSSYFYETTVNMAKGDWLGDTQPSVLNIEYRDGQLIFEAEVWGHAREIVQSSIDLKWDIMSDNGGNREKTTHFNSGNRMYVDFQTPADGFLAIYLIVDDKKTLCLLPYKGDATGRFPVKAGKKYWFFDRRVDPTVKPISMRTSAESEQNQVVLIYSPNPFTKCVDNAGSRLQLNSVDTREFRKWLLNCQRADHDMVVRKQWVEIYNASASQP